MLGAFQVVAQWQRVYLPVQDMNVGYRLGRSPGEGNGNPLQYSCLGNPMDRGAWWATVLGGGKESDTTESLNNDNDNT